MKDLAKEKPRKEVIAVKATCGRMVPSESICAKVRPALLTSMQGLAK